MFATSASELLSMPSSNTIFSLESTVFGVGSQLHFANDVVGNLPTSNTADLKILFRMTNLTGQGSRDAMSTFTASNFALTTVPEPSAVLMMTAAGAFFAGRYTWRRRRARGCQRTRTNSWREWST